jgi:hypothetical protein
MVYWVDATKDVMVAEVAEGLIPVKVTVEPDAGTAVAV